MIPPALRLTLSLRLVLHVVLLWELTLVARAAEDCRPAPERPRENLQIITASGLHSFKVEVARTPEQRAKGLMCRRTMGRDQGMLFTFDGETPIYMWMKNTYLPLDMVFVSPSGAVMAIAENTTPFSRELISSGAPAYAVIELNAGVAGELGIAQGSKVEHPVFGR
jgi:uncharacterized membrane protein (UPF0127 family)